MESTLSPIIEIKNLLVVPPGTARYYDTSRLAVAQGDVIAIITDTPVDARYLLRILATLEQPNAGKYLFNGTRVTLEDDQLGLAVKRQIGYVAHDAAMISNRTLRENLLLTRFYYENDLTIDIEKTTASLCREAGLSQKLNRRPSVLSDVDLLKAIMIREMGKNPAVMLVDRPEKFMEITENDGIFNHLKNMVQSGTALVFFSHNNKVTGLSNGRLTMAGGEIRTWSV